MEIRYNITNKDEINKQNHKIARNNLNAKIFTPKLSLLYLALTALLIGYVTFYSSLDVVLIMCINLIVLTPLLIFLSHMCHKSHDFEIEDKVQYFKYTLSNSDLNILNTILIDGNDKITKLYQHIDPKQTTIDHIIVKCPEHRTLMLKDDMSVEEKAIYDIAQFIPQFTNQTFNEILGPVIDYKQYEENVIKPLEKQEKDSVEYQKYIEKYAKANSDINNHFIKDYYQMTEHYQQEINKFKQKVDDANEKLKQLGGH